MSHNSSWLFAIVIKISPAIEACLEGKLTKFQTGTMLTSQVMDSQIHAIEKAIRPLFTDPVTNFQNLKILEIFKRNILKYFVITLI